MLIDFLRTSANRWSDADFIFNNQTVPTSTFEGFVFSADTDTGALEWLRTFPPPSNDFSEGFGVTLGLKSQPITAGVFSSNM